MPIPFDLTADTTNLDRRGTYTLRATITGPGGDGTPVLDNATATLVFGDDETLGGTGGCNSFSTTYRTAGNELTIESEIAATLRACDPETDRQEAALMEVLSNVATFEIVEDGAGLVITSTDGASISAQR